MAGRSARGHARTYLQSEIEMLEVAELLPAPLERLLETVVAGLHRAEVPPDVVLLLGFVAQELRQARRLGRQCGYVDPALDVGREACSNRRRAGRHRRVR